MKDEDRDRKARGSSGSGRSPTRFMERSEEEIDNPFRDRSGDEGVDSGQVTSHDEEDEVPFEERDSQDQSWPRKTPRGKSPESPSEKQRREDAKEYPGKDDEQD